MPQDTSKLVSISLYDRDLANLQQIGKDVGILNRSATIRFLIKYFQRTETERQNLVRESRIAYAAEMDDEPCRSLT